VLSYHNNWWHRLESREALRSCERIQYHSVKDGWLPPVLCDYSQCRCGAPAVRLANSRGDFHESVSARVAAPTDTYVQKSSDHLASFFLSGFQKVCKLGKHQSEGLQYRTHSTTLYTCIPDVVQSLA